VSHIADVPGVHVGNATDVDRGTGVTTVVFDTPATCGVATHGGAPGTRETDLLAPENLVDGVDAICLSGGSAFGLAAADGVTMALAAVGRGFPVGAHRVPIVPGAIIFDLAGERPDYRLLGEASAAAALQGRGSREIGTVGAGTGAHTARLKGGLGSASARVGDFTVGAIAVANAVGSATAANAPFFRAAPFEDGAEFGGLGAPPSADFASLVVKARIAPGESTTIAVVATDAAITKAEAKRLAIAAHDGIALAVFPAHTPFDGDVVFAAGTGRARAPESPAEHLRLAAAAASTLARAIARAVYSARATPLDRLPTWQSLYA
jgi:L-aminopeptidase/D-esterase-like protein